MLHLSTSCQYFLYTDSTDMRKGFDSLSGLVTMQLQMSALGGAVFIFFNKKRNQVKLLLWEGDGFSMYYNKSVCINSQDLQLILQGISLRSVRKRKRYQHAGENCW